MGRSAVNPAVVEVGPQTVRGPNSAPRGWISVAIECIDDRIALLDERPVEVRRLWSDLLDVVAAARGETLVLVVPTWWSTARVELVTDAARGVAAEVVALQRASMLGAVNSAATVVEFSEEFAVIASPGFEVEVLPRGDRDLAAHLGAAAEVLVDVPAGVATPAPALFARLRAAGIPVTHTDRRRVVHAVTGVLPPPAPAGAAQARSRRPATAVLTGILLSVAALGGGWAAQGLSGRNRADSPTAVLTEGRVEVLVPAQWTVERITSGPGSARLRVSAPSRDRTALHITQSVGAVPATMADVAESLRRAFESEPAGVFADFDPGGSVGGRPAVTYRELRRGSETDWAVVIDGEVRIAIGCQSAAADRATIDDVCARAVQSAHVVG